MSKGMLLVENPAQKKHRITKENGHYPAQRLGLVTPAYLKKEDGNPHPRLRKHNLCYDGRQPEEKLEVRVGS